MAVAGQQHGLVVLDGDGEPLRPAKLWNDTTSAPQAAALVERLGPEAWAQACGSVPVASFTIAKLAWLVEHEPDVALRITRIALPHDYLTMQLTGRHVTDRGDASGTGWYDTAAGRYRADLLDLVGGRSGAEWMATLPEVLPFDASAGTLTAEAAAATGLPEGIPVGAGTGDNMAAALGMGLRPGDIAVSLGTSGTAYAVSAIPTHDPTGAVAGFCDAAGGFLPLVCTLNATRVTDAVARWTGLDQAEFAAAALTSPPGAGGAVQWCRTSTGSAHRTCPTPPVPSTAWSSPPRQTELARAAHEGVVCALLDGIDALSAAGASVRSGTLDQLPLTRMSRRPPLERRSEAGFTWSGAVPVAPPIARLPPTAGERSYECPTPRRR